ncbi:MAG: hypothetical protein JO154_10930 [Chitinophaga sp.]|uniref:hypothetical protein n=1 Tax=Chitinophaga sp. TaxID=1869181 RepID=UPI0025B8CB0D|nr:hypothetical protein [Chitinophaga sp.]MBV8253111.1 hypothetical protein [Chitinophaga sp.]
MNFFNAQSSLFKGTSIAAIVFLCYGYVCRWCSIYFFWESKTIGWTLFFVSIILWMATRIKNRPPGSKAIWEMIVLGISAFILLVKMIFLVAIPHTDICDRTLTYIKQNKAIQQEVGNIKGVFVVPFGGVSSSGGSDGYAAAGDLHFVIKGDKKYIDLNVQAMKDFDTDWEFAIVR